MRRRAVLVCLGIVGSAILQGCGGNLNSDNSPHVSPQLAALAAGVQSQKFTATAPATSSLSWSVDGIAGGNPFVGTITARGVYSAPTTAGSHTITVAIADDPSRAATARISVTDLPGVLTYHNHSARDGTNSQEYALNATTVTSATFGKLFSCPVDGAIYGQPLWVPGLNFNGTLHNAIYVATEHDSVYAFDADANPCGVLWQASLLDASHGATSGETTVPCDVANGGSCAVGSGWGSIQPEIGVTGTPVIDLSSGTIYLVSKSEVVATSTFHQRLHALDLQTGTEKLDFNSPVEIAASVLGSGDGSSGGVLDFDSRMHLQRPGLALANGTVFITFGSHEDAQPYHGWLLGYKASNLLVQQSVFNTTPNGGMGAIWSSGGAPAVDADGSLYVATGNGLFDANVTGMPNNDFGDSILKLDPNAGLSIADWFTPDDQSDLNDRDADLGSGGVILLPVQTAGPAHLLVEIGKAGTGYLIDRDSMGHYEPDDNHQIVQTFTAGKMFGVPAFWNDHLYFAGGGGGTLTSFNFDPTTGLFDPIAESQSIQMFFGPGSSPSISSMGGTNGIVWALDTSAYGPPSPTAGPAVLHAYDATNLAVEYWHSAQAANHRDQAGNAVKFVPPTIANGKVYVSTRTEVTVYGLLPK